MPIYVHIRHASLSSLLFPNLVCLQVASLGAYLDSRGVIAMSFAPRDSHEAQVQFALERGVPAFIGVIGSVKLPFPPRAFDMAHCSRCLIPWARNGGMYMMEIDRVLRPGGYWVLSGPPINWKANHRAWQRTEADLAAEQQRIEEHAAALCWEKLAEVHEIGVWRKRAECPARPPAARTCDACVLRRRAGVHSGVVRGGEPAVGAARGGVQEGEPQARH
jgi:SAM-dependent methyltransferase